MRHFLYTYSEHTPRNGHTVKTVSLYRIKRNSPHHIVTRSDTFVDEFQLVMDAMEQAKALPRAALVPNQFGGRKYCNSSALREAGFATVTRV